MEIMLSVSLENPMPISIYRENEKRGLIVGNYVFDIWIDFEWPCHYVVSKTETSFECYNIKMECVLT